MKINVITYKDGTKAFTSGSITVESPGNPIINEEEKEISSNEHKLLFSDPEKSEIFKQPRVKKHLK